MNPTGHLGDMTLSAAIIPFAGGIPTWGGESYRKGEFAFAGEDGFLRFTGINRPLKDPRPTRVASGLDTVNGVAFAEHGEELYIAASTRSEINYHRYTLDGRYLGTGHHDKHVGAHGVYRTAWGGFLSPAGREGILGLVLNDGHSTCTVPRGMQGEPYYYKLASLGVHDGRELWALACRDHGAEIAWLNPEGELSLQRSFRLKGQTVDFVAVETIGNHEFPRALIALGRNSSIHFMRDVLEASSVITLNLPKIVGSAYKIRCVGAHAVLHTSRGIYFMQDLVTRLLREEYHSDFTTLRQWQIDVIDFSVAFDEWILILQPDGPIRVAVSAFLDEAPARETRDFRVGNREEAALPECDEPDTIPYRDTLFESHEHQERIESHQFAFA